MCTVMLRFTPEGRWPLLLAAVRDEFVGRSWDPPAAFWPDQPSVLAGRDRIAGGTWLAVDTAGVAVAALLNGVRRGDLEDGRPRPTRGRLPLAALAGAVGPVPGVPDDAALADYDGFHLLRAGRNRVDVWSWDGVALVETSLTPGDHIIVNLGVDRDEDPLVPHFRPLLAETPVPPLPQPPTGPEGVVSRDIATTEGAWDGWVDLLRGDGLDPADERGLIIEHLVGERAYGSTSASLVALSADGGVRYDFTATPRTPSWFVVHPSMSI